ncbi:preprotein translocase subunit SecE [Aquirhabdus parva]|uniref:Protein translocase subunit SecE n=1 Tax=Aquirhabdus parva TaxID=2283318 RepID=A0A345P7W3_9GAMM|nr:preprotein translocase subunit SecE [Aquirhabdus parva]AXI03372.1 preprotein translocase subunit SecE [Aquirhabdus parva]
MNTDPQNQSTTDKSNVGKSINSSINNLGGALSPADVVKSRSAIDPIFWLLAIVLLIGATIVPQYLPAYWAPAASVWVRVGVIVGMVVVALVLLYTTSQGKGFVTLLKDSRVELGRISWPTKNDTLHTTWIVLVVVVVMAIILWLLDMFFGWAIKLIIG